jgi:hypothetical protein
MRTIENVAFNRYKDDQSLPRHKQMGVSNYIDWANFGAREAQRFIPIEEELPPVGVEVLLQNDNWKNEDYNPEGIRPGFRDDLSGWVTATYCNLHDEYHTRFSDEDDPQFKDSKAENQGPTHWRPYFRK